MTSLKDTCVKKACAFVRREKKKEQQPFVPTFLIDNIMIKESISPIPAGTASRGTFF